MTSMEMYEQAGRPQPTEIRLKKAEKVLEIDFEDGRSFVFPAEFLRVESPSAEVRGHSPTQRQWVPGKLHVGFESLESVGNYAVRIRFDDGHDTGIYSWGFLYEYGDQYEQIWDRYCETLDEMGLSREP